MSSLCSGTFMAGSRGLLSCLGLIKGWCERVAGLIQGRWSMHDGDVLLCVQAMCSCNRLFSTADCMQYMYT